MSKDPAFLFYPGDWMGGTMTFSRSHKGAYMDLLMAQYNNGHMSIEDIKIVLGDDFEKMWELKLKSKFTQDCNGLFFNKKLEEVIEKRKLFTESRRKNLESKKSHKKTRKGKHMDVHMENEDEDEDLNKDESEKSLHTVLRNEFEKFYLKNKGIEYYFTAKDAGNLTQIINKIKKIGKTEDNAIIQNIWITILQRNEDKWVNDNLSISNVNSKFNEIIAKIKGSADNYDKDRIMSMIK